MFHSNELTCDLNSAALRKHCPDKQNRTSKTATLILRRQYYAYVYELVESCSDLTEYLAVKWCDLLQRFDHTSQML